MFTYDPRINNETISLRDYVGWQFGDRRGREQICDSPQLGAIPMILWRSDSNLGDT